jgi:hypothetical protein
LRGTIEEAQEAPQEECWDDTGRCERGNCFRAFRLTARAASYVAISPAQTVSRIS